MALPEVTLPAGTPAFLVTGHGIQERDPFANSARGQGHRRKRRLYSVTDRTASIALVLSEDQAAAVDDWFENSIEVGVTPFAAAIKSESGSGVQWWYAVWAAPPQWQPLNLGRWRLVGSLLLIGEPSEVGPAVSDAFLALSFPLDGTGDITVPVDATLGIGFPLDGLINLGDLALSFPLDLPDFELREDGTFILREDGGFVVRE
jgi:hypothetical protein